MAAAETAAAPSQRVLGVLLFPGFEPLDVVGPVSVFGSVPGVQVVYMAQAAGPVTSVTGNMTLVAGHSFASLPAPTTTTTTSDAAAPSPAQPKLSWLLVPGGIGTRQEVHNPVLLDYIRAWCAAAADSAAAAAGGLELVMSVCTGSALLAAAGVLDGRRATSNKIAFGWVASLSPRVEWVRQARWVHDGCYLTSSGVAAGTDAAVYAVKTLLSAEAAAAASKRLEHLPVTDAGSDPFADEAFLPRV